MARAPQHQFQVLTKRAARMQAWTRWVETLPEWRQADDDNWPLQNVWLGVSIEDQERADERIPLLLQTPAAVRFLSCEPLLGPLDLVSAVAGTRDFLSGINFEDLGVWPEDSPKISWVIVGGESGDGARLCHLSWVSSIVDQCRRHNVPCFVKQLGKRVCNDVTYVFGADPLLRLRHPKGGDPSEWPESLRVRDFPVA